jgi:hypothetical protein
MSFSNMKKIIGLFALVCLFKTTEFKAQGKHAPDKMHIELDLDISLDDDHKKDTSYIVTVKNMGFNQENTFHFANKVILALDYNLHYEISVTHKGYNTKIIDVYTEAPIDNWKIMADLDLSSHNQKVIQAGKILFDKKTKTFLQKKGK